MKFLPEPSWQNRPIPFGFLTKVIATIRGPWLSRIVDDALKARVKEATGEEMLDEPQISAEFREELTRHPVVPEGRR